MRGEENMIAFALAVAVSLSGAPKAAPPKKTQLKIEIHPDTAVLWVDGKKKGNGSKQYTLTVPPGNHVVKVTNKGDEHQEVVAVKKNEVKSWTWTFEDDRMDRKAAEEKRKKEEGESEESTPPAGSDEIEGPPDK
jgi:hypothetical protein